MFSFICGLTTTISNAYPQEFSAELSSSNTDQEYSITFQRAIFLLTQFSSDLSMELSFGSTRYTVSGDISKAGYYFHDLPTPYTLRFSGTGSFKFSITQVDAQCSSLSVSTESDSWKVKDYSGKYRCYFDANPFGSYEADIKDYQAMGGMLSYTGYKDTEQSFDPSHQTSISGVNHPIFLKFTSTSGSAPFKIKPRYVESYTQFDVEADLSLTKNQWIEGKNSSGGLLTWQSAVIAVAAIVFVIIIGVVIFCICKKSKDKKKKQIEANANVGNSSTPPVYDQTPTYPGVPVYSQPQMQDQYPMQQPQNYQYPVQGSPQMYPQQPAAGYPQQAVPVYPQPMAGYPQQGAYPPQQAYPQPYYGS